MFYFQIIKFFILFNSRQHKVFRSLFYKHFLVKSLSEKCNLKFALTYIFSAILQFVFTRHGYFCEIYVHMMCLSITLPKGNNILILKVSCHGNNGILHCLLAVKVCCLLKGYRPVLKVFSQSCFLK